MYSYVSIWPQCCSLFHQQALVLHCQANRPSAQQTASGAQCHAAHTEQGLLSLKWHTSMKIHLLLP